MLTSHEKCHCIVWSVFTDVLASHGECDCTESLIQQSKCYIQMVQHCCNSNPSEQRPLSRKVSCVPTFCKPKLINIFFCRFQWSHIPCFLCTHSVNKFVGILASHRGDYCIVKARWQKPWGMLLHFFLNMLTKILASCGECHCTFIACSQIPRPPTGKATVFNFCP